MPNVWSSQIHPFPAQRAVGAMVYDDDDDTPPQQYELNLGTDTSPGHVAPTWWVVCLMKTGQHEFGPLAPGTYYTPRCKGVQIVAVCSPFSAATAGDILGWIGPAQVPATLVFP